MTEQQRKRLLKPIKITAYIVPHIGDDSNPTTWFNIDYGGSTSNWPVETGYVPDDTGATDWDKTLEHFEACRQYIVKYAADAVTHALENLVEESRMHDVPQNELESQFTSSLDLKQWEEDQIAENERRDKRISELQAAGIPHDELVAIIHREVWESTALHRTWFQRRILDFAERVKRRLCGHSLYYVDSKKKWQTYGESFDDFPRFYLEYKRVWNDVRDYQKELPKSLKREEAKTQVAEHFETLVLAKDLIDCLFERQGMAYKWSPSELAIVHAARISGYGKAKMSQVRWLFDVLKNHPKYTEAPDLETDDVAE